MFRMFLSRPLRQYAPAAAVAVSAGWTIYPDQQQPRDDERRDSRTSSVTSRHWSPSSFRTRAACQEATKQDDQEEDPYENLPEHDESTTCTICMVNRRGPCRPLWRKVEFCLKDHSPSNQDQSEEADLSSTVSGACDKYMIPWFTCTQQYRHLYLQYFNQVYQEEFISPMEEALQEDERCEFTLSLEMDWQPWLAFLRNKQWSLADVICQYENDRDKSPEETSQKQEWEDPELVEISVPIAVHDAETDMPVEVAYAKDQTGAVIGFEMFSSFKKEDGADETGHVEETLNPSSTESENDAPPTHGTLRLSLQPERTRIVQVYALYKLGDKARLYESKPMLPLLVASKHGIGAERNTKKDKEDARVELASHELAQR